MFTLVSSLKALVEIAALSLLAQQLLGGLAGERKSENFVYRLLQVITAPIIKLCRTVFPQRLSDARLANWALLMLLLAWLSLVLAKAHVCQAQHLACLIH